MSLIILALSTTLQFIAAVLSIRLIRLTGCWQAWALIALAMTLMGVRRLITLVNALDPDSTYDPNALAECVALLISCCMVVGVLFIGPIFQNIQRTANSLKKSEAHNRLLLNSTAEAIFGVDNEGRCTFCNTACVNLLGYEKQNELLGIDMLEVIHNAYDENSPGDRPVEKILTTTERLHVKSEVLFRKDGSSFPVEYWARPIFNGEELIGHVVTFIDITERKQEDDLLNWQATHDALTGIYNRREFEKRMGALLTKAIEYGGEHALCYMDLNKFKEVNDSCGHLAGDEVLKQVGQLLNKQLRQCDTVARLGGDEFGMLIEDCTLEDAKRVTSSLQLEFQNHEFCWQDKKFKLGVSIGLVSIDKHTEGVKNLLQEVDVACYRSKAGKE